MDLYSIVSAWPLEAVSDSAESYIPKSKFIQQLSATVQQTHQKHQALQVAHD